MIDKEEAVRKGYKEKHHIDTYTTPTTSEITFIQEHNITSGHFVNFDKLAERSVPKLNALKQSDFTISSIDYNKSEKSKTPNVKKEFTIDQEYRIDQGYKEKSYTDINLPFQAHSVEPHDVKKGVAEKIYSDRYFPTSSKEIVIVKEIDLKPLVATQPKISYSHKSISAKEKIENKEAIHPKNASTDRLDAKNKVEPVDLAIHPDSKSSPESYYR